MYELSFLTVLSLQGGADTTLNRITSQLTNNALSVAGKVRNASDDFFIIFRFVIG